MKKNISKKMLYILTIGILVFIPLIQHISYFLQINKYINDYKDINAAIILWISIPFLLIIYIFNLRKNKFKLDIYDYLFLIFIAIGLIVCLYSYDLNTSIFGRPNRRDGFLALLCYNLLLINWKRFSDPKDLKFWYKFIVYIAIFNVAYSLLQVYTDYDFVVRTSLKMTASGFCGHNNFFGSLVVTALSLVSCKFLCFKERTIKNLLVIIFLIIGLINSQSSGPVLAYIITMIFIIIFLIIKKSISLKHFPILVVIPLFLLSGITLVNKFVFKSDVCELCDIKANVIDNKGHDRLPIWQRTFSVVQQYPIIGVGYDNLAYVYPNPYTNVKVEPSGITITNRKPNQKYYLVDNAHNVYLQTLVSSGIFGLLQYLILCILTFIKGIRSNNKIIFILLSGFIAYSIQALFNINVISVTPIYYLIIGLILSDKKVLDEIKE